MNHFHTIYLTLIVFILIVCVAGLIGAYELGLSKGQLVKLREWKDIAYPERVVIPERVEP